MVQVKHSEIEVTEWLRVARGYEVKIMSREGDVYKFNGFKEAVSVVCIAVRWPHPLLKSTCIGIEGTVSLQQPKSAL